MAFESLPKEISDVVEEIASRLWNGVGTSLPHIAAHHHVRLLGTLEAQMRTELGSAPHFNKCQEASFSQFGSGRRIKYMRCPVYEVFWPAQATDNDKREGSGRPCPWVQRALEQWNRCDYANYCLLPILKRIFAVLEPAATVEWLLVRPKARLCLIEKGAKVQLAVHSVVRITLPGGKAWILDPTGGQFGFNPRHIHVWTDYKKERVANENEYEGPRWTADTAAHEDWVKHQVTLPWRNARKACIIAYDRWLKGLGGEREWWKGIKERPEKTLRTEFEWLDRFVKEELAKASRASLEVSFRRSRVLKTSWAQQ